MTAVYFKNLDLDVSPNNPVSIVTASRRCTVSELACLVQGQRSIRQLGQVYWHLPARVAINLNVDNPISLSFRAIQGRDRDSFTRSDGPVDGLHDLSGFCVVM